MISAALPVDEDARLASLAMFHVLDTPDETDFDDLTRMAAQICEAPIALISLVDRHRQWFKSRIGLRITETPRADSFCAHALLRADLFVVPDATLDERFFDNPLVTGEPHIRFYAGAPLRADDGHTLGTLCVIDHVPRRLSASQEEALRVLARQVITHLNLRQANRDLELRTQLLQSIAHESTDAVFVKDRAGRYLLFNEAASAFVGRPVNDVLGKGDLEIFDAASAALIESRDRAVMESGVAQTDEETITASGIQRTFLAMKAPYRDKNGEIIGTIGISRDITDRKTAEAALRASEELHRTIVATVAEGLVLQRADGNITAANPSAERILGLTNDQIMGRTSYDPRWRAIHEDGSPFPGGDHPSMVALRTGKPQYGVLMGVHRPDSSLVWISINARPIFREGSSKPESVVCSFSDITDQKRAESLAGQHRCVLELIGSGAPVEKSLTTLLRVIESQCAEMHCSVLLLDEDGQHMHFAAGPRIPTPLRELCDGLAIGPSVGSCGTAAYRREPVFVTDIASDPLWAPFKDLALSLGYRACWSSPIFDRDQKVLGTFAVYYNKPGRPNEAHLRLIDTATYTAAIAISRHRSEAALQRAYDELRKSQEIVVHQERLRAFGQLASGVAHDINNAICPVSIYTKVLLKTDPTLTAQAREYLEIIQQAAKAVGDTVSRLRKFYKDQADPTGFEPLNVATMIEEVAALTRARWSDMAQERGAVIDLRIEAQPDLPAIPAVQSEISEALINLIFNAVDAMPEGGTLTIRARTLRATLDAEPQVCIEVCDTGTGMDEEGRHRCLEPFYTTKGERGTGLGLSIVAGIVQRHGAELTVQSAPGAGTTIRIVFPAPAATPASPSTPALSGSLAAMKILVADDDPLILHAMRVALESEGHEAHCVLGGQAAIGAFRDALDASEPFDVVFTDLGMPHFDGRKVAMTVKAASPGTPVILLTGWGHSMKADMEVPPGVDQVLAKPVSPQELHAALLKCPRTR